MSIVVIHNSGFVTLRSTLSVNITVLTLSSATTIIIPLQQLLYYH